MLPPHLTPGRFRPVPPSYARGRRGRRTHSAAAEAALDLAAATAAFTALAGFFRPIADAFRRFAAALPVLPPELLAELTAEAQAPAEDRSPPPDPGGGRAGGRAGRRRR